MALCRLEWVNERAFFLQIRSQPGLYPGCEGDKSCPISGTSVSHSRRGDIRRALGGSRCGRLPRPIDGEFLLRFWACIGKPELAWGRERLSSAGATFMTGNFPLNFASIAGDSSFSEKNGRLPNEQNSPTRICVEPRD
jgi:hypothetical protein